MDHKLRLVAKAVIEAIREPTPEMRLQGLKILCEILEREAEDLKDRQDRIPSGTPMMPIMFLPMRSSTETDAVYHAYLDAILGDLK